MSKTNLNTTGLTGNKDPQDPQDPHANEDIPNTDITSGLDNIIQGQLTKAMEEFKKQISAEMNVLEDSKKAFKDEKQRLLVKQYITSQGFEGELVDYVYDEDMEIVKIKLEQLNNIVNQRVQNTIMDKLKETSYTPPKSDVVGDDAHKFKKPGYMI